jgi:acyl-coenzyme A thioesterase PaaI-like protein
LLTALLDHALSAIAWEANERRACITVALDVHFLAAARPGDLVVVRGRVVRSSASLVFMQGSLTVDDQEVATGKAIMKIR